MADIHVLEKISPTMWRVAFHYPVAAGLNNRWGQPVRTAISKLISAGSMVATSLLSGDGTFGTVSAAELASLQAGSLRELVVNVKLESGGAGAVQMLVTLQAAYSKYQAPSIAELGERFGWYGWSGSAV